MNEQRSRLRKLLASPEMIVAPFVFDCLQAKLAAAAGFDAIYMTGFGTAAARGSPTSACLRCPRWSRTLALFRSR